MPRSAIASIEETAGELRVVLRGELDFIAMEEVAAQLVEFSARNGGRGGLVTLDVTHVTLVRSAVEQFLLQAADRLQRFDIMVRVSDEAS